MAERTQELTALVAQIGTSLTSSPGCQAITAARLLAETGDPRHFGREASYARFCGVAPREASSGPHVRHRLDRRGNRQLNAALHRIVVTRARMPGSATQQYLERRLREGKSRREALRALKRHLGPVDLPHHQTRPGQRTDLLHLDIGASSNARNLRGRQTAQRP